MGDEIVFFYDRVKSIEEDDRVLEIGPGGTPHPRSNEFLDLDTSLFKDEDEESLQRGHAPKLMTNKPITYYDGTKFPYKNDEFDYVIAAHVLEHVDNVELFVSELQRVAKRGYIEYPTIVYDYLYNFPVHLNFIHYDIQKNTIFYYKKSSTPLDYFIDVQKILLETLGKGYSETVDSCQEIMFEGFEWDKSKTIKCKKVSSIKAILPKKINIPKKIQQKMTPVQIEIEKEIYINNVRAISTKTIAKELAKRPLRKSLAIIRNKNKQ